MDAAIKLLTKNMQNGVLPINKDILDLLKQKHRKAEPVHESVLHTGTLVEIHPVRCNVKISAGIIRKAAIKTKGRSGPSGMDAEG